MPHIYICFVWHMHQPFYKDLVSGEYKLPWTRMHALKDYYGMVKILEDFPQIHQTFNLVPSMLVQIEEYASGKAGDAFLRAALRPAEQLDEATQQFILQYFFQANPQRMIYRYPRYGELFDLWQSHGRDFARARRAFPVHALRDLQVLSQLAWFDEEYLTRDPDLRDLVKKGRGYSGDDQALLGRKQIAVCGNVLPVYREFSSRGQIEVSTTPFYHPILPLLCDSNIADVAHPYVPLPSRFQYPRDAMHQLETAREYCREKLGRAPLGLWPSEGAVSDQAMELAYDAGFRWFATDNGVLARTLHRSANPDLTYRPYVWNHGGRSMHCLFRDHFLSDLIGFVYSRMGAAEAASHFLDRVRENCHSIRASGRDALVPVILDGENAWEYYEESGRPFLRELYRRITDDPQMTALTVSEAINRLPADTMDGVKPGSWINANFDVWIGAEEDNRAWELLLRARQAYDRAVHSTEGAQVSEERQRLAYEELLIAEGSDWCWWYGPEHDSANRPEFDQLFRDHLANVYLALNLTPPEELSRTILKVVQPAFHQPPGSPIKATIDGKVTSYFEWMGAGLYRVDNRSGAMHGRRFLVHELRYGSDGHALYLRLDFNDSADESLHQTELRMNVQRAAEHSRLHSLRMPMKGESAQFSSAFSKVFEAKITLAALDLQPNQPVRFQISLWQDGLPVDALPADGWIEVITAEPHEWSL